MRHDSSLWRPHVETTASHVSIIGHVDEMHEDMDLADIDHLAQQYTGRAYPQRDRRRISAWIAVDGWHAWGALKDSSQPG